MTGEVERLLKKHENKNNNNDDNNKQGKGGSRQIHVEDVKVSLPRGDIHFRTLKQLTLDLIGKDWLFLVGHHVVSRHFVTTQFGYLHFLHSEMQL